MFYVLILIGFYVVKFIYRKSVHAFGWEDGTQLRLNSILRVRIGSYWDHRMESFRIMSISLAFTVHFRLVFLPQLVHRLSCEIRKNLLIIINILQTCVQGRNKGGGTANIWPNRGQGSWHTVVSIDPIEKITSNLVSLIP